MNQSHIKSLCLHFNLGLPKQEPERVYGGLLHIMWRIETAKGTYAVKQLSQHIDLTDNSIVNNYNLSEEIAARFIKHEISAVGAIKASGCYLYQTDNVTDNVGFLVYEWVNGKILDKNIVNTPQALKIAAILSKIHLLNLNVPEILEPEFDIHDNDKIIALANLAQKKGCPFAPLLIENLQDLLAINRDYQNAISILENNVVISHGDLDQKNVLWDDSDNPILIDWESARKLNPTYEIVNVALDWSGITAQLDKTLFRKMIDAYKAAGGIIDEDILEAAFYGVLGNCINWMVYNIQRACNEEDPEQQSMGIEQVALVLPTILRIKELMPELSCKTRPF